MCFKILIKNSILIKSKNKDKKEKDDCIKKKKALLLVMKLYLEEEKRSKRKRGLGRSRHFTNGSYLKISQKNDKTITHAGYKTGGRVSFPGRI